MSGCRQTIMASSRAWVTGNRTAVTTTTASGDATVTYAYDELNRMAAVARGAEVHQYVCDRPVDRTIAIAMPSIVQLGQSLKLEAVLNALSALRDEALTSVAVEVLRRCIASDLRASAPAGVEIASSSRGRSVKRAVGQGGTMARACAPARR
jgi:hypothetical protein